jgi:tripartite-type tricarboxylate transporter receptor subunit TctC
MSRGDPAGYQRPTYQRENIMNRTVRSFPALVAMAVLGSSALIFSAAAQNYPAKPVRVIIPGAPGSNTDFVFRVLYTRMGTVLGQQLIVDYRPGAGGMLGAAVTCKSPPDGYTVAFVSGGFVMNPAITKDMPYDPTRDFSPLGIAVDVPSVLVTHPSVPARNLKELIALAKAKPGQLNFGSSGQGTNGHFGGVLFNLMANVNTVHVPYKSSAVYVDLMAGHIEFSIASIPAVLGYAHAGKMRMLGQTGAKRFPTLPDVPTMNEAGLPGYFINSGFALIGPQALPGPVVQTLNAALVKTLQDPAVRKTFFDNGADPVGSTPQDHDAFIKAEVAKWQKVARAAGIKPE